ncbi:MAG: AAA family ATPase [Anaerobutyricum sp.]|nr:AAA family ATPase [Anaerobutyricum sp.]
MSRMIAVANQKGGVGKTTTSINLSACLAEKGKKVLLVDMDSQGNTTSGLGLEKNELENTIYEVLRDEVSINDAIIEIEDCFGNLSLIPANRNLAGAEIELITAENMQYILKEKLAPIRDQYDFIILDCPPALGMLTVNAMTASDSVLVPIQCEFYALDGLSQLIYTIELIQKNLNPNLYIEGVVFTMFDARTNLSLQVVENVKDNLNQNIYKTIIPRNVRLAEAPSHGLPINLYDKKSSGSEAYKLLADEVISNGEDERK